MRNAFILVLAILGGYFFFLREKDERPQETSVVEQVPSSPTKTEKKNVRPRPVPVSSKPLYKRSSTTVQAVQKKEDGVVEFQVVEGSWAVSQGDQLLGTVEPTFKAKKGFAKVNPRIRGWENWEIPYVIDAKIKNRERIYQAIDWFHRVSDFEFIELNEVEGDLLAFIPAQSNCYSYVGRIGGAQPILLSDQCRTKEVAHEIMHALGFVHEQSRVDRDEYLEVLWDNIQKEFHAQFEIVQYPHLDNLLDYPFDFQSIMIYDKFAFSKAGRETMRVRSSSDEIAPSVDFFSPLDQERLRNYFQIF